MDQLAGTGLAASQGADSPLGGLNKRARLSDSISRFGRQDFAGVPRNLGQDPEPGTPQDLANDLCEDSKASKKSVMSHVATEQRRRDRINEGFNALRDLIPHKDKMDKATFLQQTVEYIKQLQAVMHQLLAMGAIKNLPEETQWSIRLLLPRKKEEVTIPAPTPAPVQMPGNQMPGNQQMGNQMGGGMTNQASSGMMNSAQFLPYMLQQQGQPQQGMMTQSSMQVPDNSNNMQPQQQMQQQAPQQPQQQLQQAAMPPQSTAPTVELKAPNNQSQTVQLDLSNVSNMLQLQALLQQSQMQMAQQQAVRNLWGAGQDASPWTMSQLQQMMQPQPQLSSGGLQIPQETLNMLANQQALNMLMPHGNQNTAPQQNPNMLQNPQPQQQQPAQQMTHQMTHQNPTPQPPMAHQNSGAVPNQSHLATAPSGGLPQIVPQVGANPMNPVGNPTGCGASPQGTNSEPSSPDKMDARGPIKARKGPKIRRHTTASKIAKPPTAGPPSQMGAGRPEALSLSS